MTVLIDGIPTKKGDTVCFKSDVEQCGTVVGFRRGMFGETLVVLENKNGFEGEYIGGQTKTEVPAEECWVE